MRTCLVALAAILGLPALAAACSCNEMTPQEAFANAEAVFEGRVVTTSVNGGVRTARLRVTQAWKGVQTEEVTLTTPAEESLCGVPFVEGSHWFVYAGGSGTDLCQRTRVADDASEDRASFGAGVTPVDPNGDAPRTPEDRNASRGGCASCSASATNHDGLILALLLVSFRRRYP
ncbi:MAG: hypothetical protein AAGE52_15900 [Myxococcota bacterium]